jgi:L-threonylcarbamoyladenylate synthase
MDRKYVTETVLADTVGIARGVDILRAGGLVAVPTETVYGLAARADSEEAVGRIFEAKGRPAFNPLIVHVLDIAAAETIAEIDERARMLAERFWPGPLTMVLSRRPDAQLAPQIAAGLPTIAVRSPAHPAMRAILEGLGQALAAPSANASETVSPTSAAHVMATLDRRIDAVVDGGLTDRGLESTIIALREDGRWSLLREGPITRQDLGAVLGEETPSDGTIEAPGQLARHYAPGKPVRLNARHAEEGEFLIGFGSVTGDVTLSESGEINEAARNLYACLHLAREAPQLRIAVAAIPDEGVGKAINDRLRRAAAPGS